MNPRGTKIATGLGLTTFYNIYETLFESVRLSTFSNWESKYLTKEEASREGRVECRAEGKIKLQCIFCGIFVNLDIRSDKMKFLLQKSHSPYCPIYCSHPTGNVPLSTDNLDEAEVYEFLEKYLKERKDNKHISLGYNPEYGESDNERGFEEPYRRQGTFKDWPLDFYPERLIEAGFIYTGLSDFVLCPKCGIGFYNWSPEDNPWKVHISHCSACPYITLKDQEGESFIQINFRALTDYEEELLLKHPIGKLMMELLPNADVKIKETLSSFLTTYGVMPITIGQAVAFMHRKKDQYDREFRNAMKLGKHKISFVSADDINERFIEVSEEVLSSKKPPKINLNRNDSTKSSVINEDCIDGNINGKFASDKNIKIEPAESCVNSSSSTTNYIAYHDEVELDSICHELPSNNKSEDIKNLKVLEEMIKQTYNMKVGNKTQPSNQEEYDLAASSTMVENSIEPEQEYFDSTLSPTFPYLETGNIDLDLNFESLGLSSLDRQWKYFEDFNDYSEFLSSTEDNKDLITIDHDQFSQLRLND